MTRLSTVLSVIATLAFWAAAPGASQSRLIPHAATALQDGLIVTAEGFIRPGYDTLAAETDRLHDALTAYCAGGSSFGPVRGGFEGSFLAWQRISVIQIGPIMEAEGPMRFQLWPDPKGFSRRAIRAAVGRADPALLEPGALEGHSIALVNLTALEALLFPEPPKPGTYACDLGRAIASFQADLAADLAATWAPGTGFRAAYDTALSGNATYPNVDALLRELLAGFVVYTDRLRKFKIERGLGAAKGDARPERLEANRSGLGLASMQAGFETLAEAYTQSGGLFERTSDAGGSMDHFLLADTARSLATTLALMPGSLEEIAEEDGLLAAELRRFGQFVAIHEDYLKTGLPRSIGLTSGFTSADGD